VVEGRLRELALAAPEIPLAGQEAAPEDELEPVARASCSRRCSRRPTRTRPGPTCSTARSTVSLRSIGRTLRCAPCNWHVAGGFLAAGQALNEELARRSASVFARYARGLPRAKREVVAAMIVEVISSMLFFAARRRGSAEAILDETKVMLRRYLEPYVRPRARGRAR
jgi:hypothetical protein